MKAKALTPEWFGACPRYLTAERFCRTAAIANGEKRIETMLQQGVLPSRRFGRYLMVDMHELMLMLPGNPVQEESVD